MARSRLQVLAAVVLFGAVGCFTPVTEPGGTSGGATTGAGSGTSGGTGTAGTTGGTSTGGGSTSGGGDAGPMCPSTCPVLHSGCDQATTTDGTCICDPGYSPCGNACVSLASDQNNCGYCGNVCDPSNGYTCVNSQCLCGAGNFWLCPDPDGGPDVCADSTVDPHNCGYCGHDCGSLMCSNGSCTCNSPLYQCTASDGTAYCADISSDIDNCGKCGKICGPPANSHDVRALTWQCVSTTGGPGICACKTGFFQCPSSATMVDCVDSSSDAFNCGSCNQVCDGGACSNSRCIDCKRLGRTCFVDTDCCPGLHCDQNINLCKA